MSYMVDHSLKEKAGASGTSVYGIASGSYGDSLFIFVTTRTSLAHNDQLNGTMRSAQ